MQLRPVFDAHTRLAQSRLCHLRDVKGSSFLLTFLPMLQELQMFSMRLSELSVKMPISPDVLSVLWQQCGKMAAMMFVDG